MEGFTSERLNLLKPTLQVVKCKELVTQRAFTVTKNTSLCKKASNHHANLPLEMYSFTL